MTYPVENPQPVGRSGQWVDRVLGVRHQADHGAGSVADPGDAPGRRDDLVATLQRRSGASVAMLERVADYAGRYSAEIEEDRRFARALMTHHGAPDQVIADTEEFWSYIRATTESFQADVRLADGDRVRAGGRSLRVIARPGHSTTDTLLVDDRDGIAFVGDLLQIQTAKQRYAGYLDAMRGADLRVVQQDTIHDCTSASLAEAAVTALMRSEDPPTALFTAQNFVTFGALRALRHLGLQHRVAVVGFDDFALADLLEPGVTVVAQDAAAIGRRAAERLFSRFDGDDSPYTVEVVPSRLVVRGSGEIAPP